MGVIDDPILWVCTGVVISVGGVFVALARCAVAEVALRMAARLRFKNPRIRAESFEEWLRVMEDMRPAERPSYAGGLLWSGLKVRPVRAVIARAARAEFASIGDFCVAAEAGRTPRLLIKALTRVRYFIRPTSMETALEKVEEASAKFQKEFEVLEAQGPEASRAAVDSLSLRHTIHAEHTKRLRSQLYRIKK